MPKCLKNKYQSSHYKMNSIKREIDNMQKYHYLKILFKHIEIGNQEIEFVNKVLFWYYRAFEALP